MSQIQIIIEACSIRSRILTVTQSSYGIVDDELAIFVGVSLAEEKTLTKKEEVRLFHRENLY